MKTGLSSRVLGQQFENDRSFCSHFGLQVAAHRPPGLGTKFKYLCAEGCGSSAPLASKQNHRQAPLQHSLGSFSSCFLHGRGAFIHTMYGSGSGLPPAKRLNAGDGLPESETVDSLAVKLASLTDAVHYLVSSMPAMISASSAAASSAAAAAVVEASSAAAAVSAPASPLAISSGLAAEQGGQSMLVDESGPPDAWHAVFAKLNKEPKLANQLITKFKDLGAKLGKTLRALGKSKIHAAKLVESIAKLETGSLLVGSRPWKLPSESAHWRLDVSDEETKGDWIAQKLVHHIEKINAMAGAEVIDQVLTDSAEDCLKAHGLLKTALEKDVES